MKIKFWILISVLVYFSPPITVNQALGEDAGKMAPNSIEFRIFLLNEKGHVDVLNADIRKLKLQKQPVVSTCDILSYSKDDHEMVLTPTAFKRLMGSKNLDFPFVVCVGNERIYAGCVWSDILSASFGGVAILKHTSVSETTNRHFLDQEGHKTWEESVKKWSNGNTISFNLGYPTPKFFNAKDLRNDPRIISALKTAGKLKE